MPARQWWEASFRPPLPIPIGAPAPTTNLLEDRKTPGCSKTFRRLRPSERGARLLPSGRRRAKLSCNLSLISSFGWIPDDRFGFLTVEKSESRQCASRQFDLASGRSMRRTLSASVDSVFRGQLRLTPFRARNPSFPGRPLAPRRCRPRKDKEGRWLAAAVTL